jgi:hypothetical protein
MLPVMSVVPLIFGFAELMDSPAQIVPAAIKPATSTFTSALRIVAPPWAVEHDHSHKAMRSIATG